MVSKRLRLANGTRVLFAPLKETKAVTVLILFPVGSRHETKKLNGSSHFLEHLFFKGTTNRPSTLEISKELDGVGAEYNAFTAKDHTGYYVKVAADKLELALDILSDMLYHSLFDPKEIERERGVIIEEINMYEDNPMMHIDELFEGLVFQGSTLSWHIAGPRELIRSIQREQLMRYKAQFYTPSNLLLTIAGHFNEQQAHTTVKRYFENIRGPVRTARFSRFLSSQKKPRAHVHFRETEQVQVAMGFPSYSLEHPQLPALTILTTILGGNMSSRLFINIRERLGLAYFIRAETNVYQDTGNVVIRAGLDRKRLKEAFQKIWKELRLVWEKGVTKEELTRAQEFIKGKIILGLEDSEHVADWVGKQLLLRGKIETPEQKIAKLMRVTTQEVQKIAHDVFQRKRLNLALIGPYKSGREFVSWFQD